MKRAVVIALAALGVVACSSPVVTSSSSWSERGPSEGGTVLVELALRSLPVETSDDSLLAPGAPTMVEALERLARIEKRQDVKGLFLRLGSFGGGWGRLTDLGAEFARIKAARHLPIHCHFDELDNAGYAFAARVCDRITMTPAGDLGLVGVAGQVFHLRALLDSVGVTADFMHVGRFKGAAEPLTHESMSPETRESLTALLGDLQGVLTSHVAAGRGLDAEAVARAIDAGPHDSTSAREHRLVDHVAYDDEARQLAKDAASATRVERMPWTSAPEELTLGALFEALRGDVRRPTYTEPHVAVVVLSDDIRDDEASSAGAGAAGPFVRELRRLADDELVKAVVLRMNSPGGSALASDKMWHAVRRVAGRKPVFVSVGDMAASGGYYIAAGAQEIHASPGSIVGSIGVVGGKLEMSGLFARLGIRAETIPFGRNAGWQSPSARFSESERRAIQQMMDRTYERFIDRVHLGRGLDVSKIRAAAEGRVWSGERGLGLELLNTTTTQFADVLRRARERGNVTADAPLEVWPRKRNFVERLGEALSEDEASSAALVTLALHYVGDVAPDVLRVLRTAKAWFASESVRLELPFALHVE